MGFLAWEKGVIVTRQLGRLRLWDLFTRIFWMFVHELPLASLLVRSHYDLVHRDVHSVLGTRGRTRLVVRVGNTFFLLSRFVWVLGILTARKHCHKTRWRNVKSFLLIINFLDSLCFFSLEDRDVYRDWSIYFERSKYIFHHSLFEKVKRLDTLFMRNGGTQYTLIEVAESRKKRQKERKILIKRRNFFFFLLAFLFLTQSKTMDLIDNISRDDSATARQYIHL